MTFETQSVQGQASRSKGSGGPISNFFHSVSDFRRFSKRDVRQNKFVFYSEHESYWKYLGPVIESLLDSHGQHICYLTSSSTDPILCSNKKGISAHYIGSGIIRTMVFASLKAGLMIMTMPGLGTSYIRRSPHRVHYVFLPHAMVSTHMAFPTGSYDHFDTIFCVGPHHTAELFEAEKIYGLPSRQLVEGGYVWLDTFKSRAEKASPPATDGCLQVMIAPTWGPASMLEHQFSTLVEAILSAGVRIIFRPHRDSWSKNKKCMNKAIREFAGHPNFIFGSEAATFDALCSSHLLITDWSGSALSFAFGLERPVLFIDTPQKIINQDFTLYKSIPLEISLRHKIGAVLSLDELDQAPEMISDLYRKTQVMAAQIRIVRDDNIYRTEGSATIAGDYLMDIARQLPAEQERES